MQVSSGPPFETRPGVAQSGQRISFGARGSKVRILPSGPLHLPGWCSSSTRVSDTRSRGAIPRPGTNTRPWPNWTGHLASNQEIAGSSPAGRAIHTRTTPMTVSPSGKAPICNIGTSRFDSDHGLHSRLSGGISRHACLRSRCSQEREGASPSSATNIDRRSSVNRALLCEGRGHRFESCRRCQAPSSNGRMPVFDTGDTGSIPVGATNHG